MKNIFSQILGAIIIIISSCSCTHSNEQIISKKHNYVVILDLSDRLLYQGQAEKDSAIILAAFNEFEKSARSPLIVTSNDRFIIRILPQKGSPLKQDFFENKLNLDLSTIDAAHKNNMFVAFKSELTKTISELYKEAHLGNKSENYFGVDIWKFFNDQINTVLKNDAENKVVMLTDGYFDFNVNTHVIHNRNKCSCTDFLKKLNGKDWQTKAEKDGVGLIPVTISTKAKWVIAGIHSKQPNNILMEEELIYFWKKWLKESGADEPKIVLDGASSVMINQYKD